MSKSFLTTVAPSRSATAIACITALFAVTPLASQPTKHARSGAREAPASTDRLTLASTRESTRQDSAIATTGSAATSAIDAATREYRARGIARAVPLGNFVAFPFGHSQPVLTCTVLRVCVIELEAGEQVVNEPIAGDQARWIIQPARSGPSGRNTLIVVKPRECDVTTNLVIPTDRRIYDLMLDSPPCAQRTTNPRQAYVRHVRFYYPDDSVGGAGAREVSSARGVGAESAGVAASGSAAVARTTINRDYRIRRERRGPFGIFGRKPLDFPWKPAGIFDDGVHVYVKVPFSARHAAAPVLYAVEDDGTRTMVNYAVRDSAGAPLYVTDRTFRRGVMVLTSGRREQRLEFENRAWGRESKEASKENPKEKEHARRPRAVGAFGAWVP
jgi:type IV secretion system protein VirB9